MKTLKESILKSVKADKYALIEEWCKKFKPFDGFYKINSNNEIEATRDNELILDYIEYDELPEYIQFADSESLKIYIGGNYSRRNKSTIIRNIKSFRGLPKLCYNLYFHNCRIKKLPKLEMAMNHCLFYAEIGDIEEIHLDFQSIGMFNCCNLTIRKNFIKNFKNVYIKNVNTIDITYDDYFSEEFSKAIGKKSRLNRSRGKYEFPMTEEDVAVINTFFGKTVDISNLKNIRYTQNLQLIKYNGKWYRCRYW